MVAVMALAAVVLPMPISPVPRRSAPAAMASSASAAPCSIAAIAPLASHRRPHCQVLSAVRDPSHHEPVPRGGRCGHAEVGHHDAGADLPGEDVDRGATVQEVLDHLRGHGLRVGAHPLGDDAVIGREGEDHWLRHARRPAGERDQAHGQLLQPSETTGRLGQGVEVTLGLGRRGGVGSTDRVTKSREHRGGLQSASP
jgi:hypothetical protein